MLLQNAEVHTICRGVVVDIGYGPKFAETQFLFQIFCLGFATKSLDSYFREDNKNRGKHLCISDMFVTYERPSTPPPPPSFQKKSGSYGIVNNAALTLGHKLHKNALSRNHREVNTRNCTCTPHIFQSSTVPDLI